MTEVPEVVEVDGDRGFEAPCWCGEQQAWYSLSFLRRRCGGSGYLSCYCGGDFCVCHHHGEAECFGCADCESPGDDDYWYEDDLP